MIMDVKFPLAALLLAAALLPALAQAQDTLPPVAEQDGVLVLNRLGNSLQMPMPDWLESVDGAFADRVEIRYLNDDRQALLEIRPKGETQALWNTLYGARIMLGGERPLSAVRAALMTSYAATCNPDATGFFQLKPDDGENLAPLGFVCGHYRDDLTNYSGLGEVAVMSFKKTATGVATVFQEWRGKAFDPAAPATWPVATDVVQARANELQDHSAFSALD
jgi:hypothetical protein